MIVDTRDDLCTGTALSRDLVLTAAHCVIRKVDYTIKPYQTGVPIPVRAIARHPTVLTKRATRRAAPQPISRFSNSPVRCRTSLSRQRLRHRDASPSATHSPLQVLE